MVVVVVVVAVVLAYGVRATADSPSFPPTTPTIVQLNPGKRKTVSLTSDNAKYRSTHPGRKEDRLPLNPASGENRSTHPSQKEDRLSLPPTMPNAVHEPVEMHHKYARHPEPLVGLRATKEGH